MAYPEILAPAGGQEQLLAAVRCGAEAVYLGAAAFNARRNASNFSGGGLAEAARYCRTHGVKLYVTVNTLVTDRELPALEETAEEIARAGADGVILQDMAALRLFAGRYPTLHRVASTQTAVHNVDGARFLQDIGFDSFVLARELSLREMERICAAVRIPAEAFVHGAHCMSLSGACTLSAMLRAQRQPGSVRPALPLGLAVRREPVRSVAEGYVSHRPHPFPGRRGRGHAEDRGADETA